MTIGSWNIASSSAEEMFQLPIVRKLDQSWYGYSGAIASMIEVIRTDLDSFTDAESKILENHGYYMADIGIRCHLKDLGNFDRIPFLPPHPEVLHEDVVGKALRHSHKRTAFVHRWFAKDTIKSGIADRILLGDKMKATFDELLAHYPKPTSNDADKARSDLYHELGGQWPSLINDKNYRNTCAIRMSIAHYRSGHSIPNQFKEAQDKDDNTIILKVRTFHSFMKKTYGESSWGMSKPPGSDIEGDVPKIKGIVVYHADWTDATGHFDMWNGKKFVGSGNFADLEDGYDIALWFL